MTTSTGDIAYQLSAVGRGITGVSAATILGAAVVETVDNDTLVNFMPIIKDLIHPLLGSIPFLGILFGGLKIINAGLSAYIGYTKFSSTDPQSEPGWFKFRGPQDECYLNSILEVLSGSALMGGGCAALYSTITMIPSIALAYIGFAFSSLIDLGRAIDRMCRAYQNAADDEAPKVRKEIFHTAIIDFSVSLLKCTGWMILAFSSILGASSLAITLGWALIGVAAGSQFFRYFGLAIYYGIEGILDYIGGVKKAEPAELQQANASRAFI